MHSFRKACVAITFIIATYSGNALARGIIREPGQHTHYSVELEPHLVFDWAGIPGVRTDGFGAGLRASVPLMHNGPIDTINNNMAIGFGFDWVHGSRPCAPRPDPRVGWYEDCSIDSFWFPVVLQWNFYLTDIISVFGEPGIAIVHHRWERWGRCWSPDYCDPDGNDTTLRPVLWGGARFMFSDHIGASVRLGFPSITAGISFLL